MHNINATERSEIINDTIRNTTNSLKNFIKVLTELGYSESGVMGNLDNIITEVTNGKMYLEESDNTVLESKPKCPLCHSDNIVFEGKIAKCQTCQSEFKPLTRL